MSAAHVSRDITCIASITPADADDFRRWLESKVGDNTTRRACGRAKQFFHAAVRRRLIDRDANPFGDMSDTTVRANRARAYRRSPAYGWDGSDATKW